MREGYRQKILGSDAVVGPSGFVDTINGCVMTSDTVLSLVRETKSIIRSFWHNKKRNARKNKKN